ncbi:MAG: hypothetical protein M0R22_01595 [Dehalococcoidia bacterium]|jgi:hypothetical protein|nr:hypothetical protein [Dehalococcoidia bacterium]
MLRGTTARPVLAVLCCTLLFASLPGCDSVDEFIEEAEDVAQDVGDVVKDVVDEAKDLIPSDTPGGASTERPATPTGDISTGPTVQLASQVVEPSGGTIVVSKPGDPLDGLTIEVPSGAYDSARQFNISSTPVTGHTFGENFNPLTPLIKVENGGGYSTQPMTVTIPCHVTAGTFAMAFFYDTDTGTLEGMPLAAVDAGSITVETRHFSWFTISGIQNEVLDSLLKKGIDSGFRPGADDWQFPNYGSYIAPDGHCVGQSLTALYYYCERPDGPDSFLWGLYDNNGNEPATPAFDADDSYGFRLASTVNQDIDWSSFQNQFLYQLRGASDAHTFKAFAYAMKLTGEPQEVGIYCGADGSGHDMIVYRVDTKGLSIADPNFPGNTERRIEYANGKFSPYNSGTNAAEIAAGNGRTFETIQYCAKTATVDWNKIAQRWSEFKDGTIGDDRFPDYSVQVQPSPGVVQDLEDGYVSPTRDMPLFLVRQFPANWRLYLNGVETPLAPDGTIRLADGNNRLGVLVIGDVANNPQQPNWQYIDFKYFNVVYGEEEPAPSDIPFVTLFVEGQPGQAYDTFREAHNYSGPGWFGVKIDNYVPITWKGLNFSGSLTLEPSEGATGTGSVVVSGHLSRVPDPVHPVLLTVNYTRTYDSVQYDVHETGYVFYVITDIPLDCNEIALNSGSEIRSVYKESSGAAMQKYLTSLEYRLDATWLGEGTYILPDQDWTYTDTTCSSAGAPGERQTEFTIIFSSSRP